MSFALSAGLVAPAAIPSPSVSSFQIGPITIHIYALCLLAGIIVAVLMTNHRLTKWGAEKWITIDIAFPAFVLGIIGARTYHVLTHPGDYFYEGHEWWNPFVTNAVWNIWDGGIAIFGALIGGAIGAWIGCRYTGIRFWTFADALAPGLLFAQAIGRLGNWFNHELFGGPTDLPWGLEIDAAKSAIAASYPAGTLFHPTFLYEMLWNLLGVVVLLMIGRRLQWGKLFAIYLIWYGAGRIVWESIRVDPSEMFWGIRTNVWAAIFAVALGVVIFIVQSRRHHGIEPSPYRTGKVPEWAQAAIDLREGRAKYVDVSEPPTAATKEKTKA